MAAIAIPTRLGLGAAVVIVTGDDVRNSAITTQILRGAPRLPDPSPCPLRVCERLRGPPPRIQLDVFTAIADTGVGAVR